MLGKINNILTAAQNALVQSVKNTQSAIDKAQQRLASGKDVNSAIDNPSSFFTSRALTQNAQDLRKLLDGIGSNIQTIKGASAGAEGIIKLIDLAEALLDEARTELYSGDYTSLVTTLSSSDVAAILAANPGVSYSAATRSFYQIAGPANWTVANATAQAATLVPPGGMPSVAGVTGHLANIGSAAENAYIDGLVAGNAWLGGSDTIVEGEWRWSGGPEAGDQFWQGTGGGSAVGGAYTNWGPGEPNNSGNEDALHIRPDGRWNDQSVGTAYQYIIEWDESAFITTTDETLVERAEDYARQYLKIMDQITALAKDTQYRGVQLLTGENLRTDFNAKRTSFLETEGMDATAAGLGLGGFDNFLQLGILDDARTQLRNAREDVRGYMNGLALDLNIMTVRLDFTKATINVHEDGASALVDADKNEVGAELLALQLRQQLQMSALRLAGQNFIQRLF